MAKKVYIGANLQKITLTNLAPVINGSDGWSRSSTGGTVAQSVQPRLYATNYSLYFMGSPTAVETCATSTTTVSLIPSHQYYVSYWYYGDEYAISKSCSTNMYWPVAEPPFDTQTVTIANTWTRYSAISSRSSFTAGDYPIRIDFNNNKKPSNFYVDGLMIVDLTAAFGSGNEPNKSWCDANIPYFANSATVDVESSSGVARRVKKIYIGVDGIARRVKKAYIGVDGVARLFWTGGGELAYHGTLDPMSSARGLMGAASVGDYAIFAGGIVTSTCIQLVEVYDKSLVKTTTNSLSIKRCHMAAATVGNRALFCGGRQSTSSVYSTVDIYSSGLTHTTGYELSNKRYALSAATIGDYALFGGGRPTSSTYCKIVDAFNSSLTRSAAAELSQSAAYNSATATNNYAIFAGGERADGKMTITDAYNASLTKASIDSLSYSRTHIGAASVGDYALFGGGLSGGGMAVVDAFNSSLTRTTADNLSARRYSIMATTVGGYAIFGGGTQGALQPVGNVDAYDEYLTVHIMPSLSAARGDGSALTIGDYAIFAGGQGTTSSTAVGHKTVEAYVVK